MWLLVLIKDKFKSFKISKQQTIKFLLFSYLEISYFFFLLNISMEKSL